MSPQASRPPGVGYGPFRVHCPCFSPDPGLPAPVQRRRPHGHCPRLAVGRSSNFPAIAVYGRPHPRRPECPFPPWPRAETSLAPALPPCRLSPPARPAAPPVYPFRLPPGRVIASRRGRAGASRRSRHRTRAAVPVGTVAWSHRRSCPQQGAPSSFSGRGPCPAPSPLADLHLDPYPLKGAAKHALDQPPAPCGTAGAPLVNAEATPSLRTRRTEQR